MAVSTHVVLREEQACMILMKHQSQEILLLKKKDMKKQRLQQPRDERYAKNENHEIRDIDRNLQKQFLFKE